MNKKDRIDAFGAGLLVGQSMLLGLNQVLIKIVNTGLAPVFQAGLRSVVATFPILIFAIVTRKRLSITDGSLVPGIFCGILFASEFILLFMALDYTTVSRATVFFYTMPFWVALVAHFLIPGERLTVLRVAGLVLALCGVAWALLGENATAGRYGFYADIACLFGAMFWAGIALLTRLTRFRNATPVMQLLYQLAVSSVILMPAAPLFGGLVRDFTPMIGGIFAFQVLVVVGVGFLVWFWVLSIYPTSDMASFGFLTPLFGVSFGWLILDEQVSIALIGGLAMVSVGIVLINRKPKRVPG